MLVFADLVAQFLDALLRLLRRHAKDYTCGFHRDFRGSMRPQITLEETTNEALEDRNPDHGHVYVRHGTRQNSRQKADGKVSHGARQRQSPWYGDGETVTGSAEALQHAGDMVRNRQDGTRSVGTEGQHR